MTCSVEHRLPCWKSRIQLERVKHDIDTEAQDRPVRGAGDVRRGALRPVRRAALGRDRLAGHDRRLPGLGAAGRAGRCRNGRAVPLCRRRADRAAPRDGGRHRRRRRGDLRHVHPDRRRATRPVRGGNRRGCARSTGAARSSRASVRARCCSPSRGCSTGGPAPGTGRTPACSPRRTRGSGSRRDRSSTSPASRRAS